MNLLSRCGPFLHSGWGRLARNAAAAVGVLLLGACAQSLDDDTLVPLMSLQEEEEVGRLQHPRMLAAFGGAYDDAALDSYVGEVTLRVIERANAASHVRRVTVLDSPSVNAFALPGGYIYVTRGLLALANDEAELATVIAHEIGHVTARHPAKRIARLASAEILDSVFGRVIAGEEANRVATLGSQGYIAHYSRLQEFEADEIGIRSSMLAGYDPTAALSFLTAMDRDQALQAKLLRKKRDSEDTSYMSAHPPTPERRRHAAEAVAKLPRQGERRRDSYLSRIDGLVFGDTPKNGIVRGRSFYQPELGFMFTVPRGYAIHNRPNAVVAVGEGKKLILFDSAKISARMSLTDFLQNEWAAALAVRDAETFTANGLEAATAYAPLGHRDVRLIAVRFDSDRVYRFIVLDAPNSLQHFDGDIRRLAESFRRLGAAEARNVRPLRLVLHKVRSGETVESLANTLPFATDRLERFRVLNNLDAGAGLEPGTTVKLVAG